MDRTMTAERHKPIRVLLVDDEADLVDFLAHRFLKQGYTVSAITDPTEALAVVHKQIFDVAILDLKMPQMDGIELLKRIHVIQPYLQAIMLTGHGSTESALEAGRLDAYRYLIKPYDYDELISQIESAWQRREEILEAAYQKELQEAISPGHTSQEILHLGDELCRKYERD